MGSMGENCCRSKKQGFYLTVSTLAERNPGGGQQRPMGAFQALPGVHRLRGTLTQLRELVLLGL
jgi:hypothetical protein